jgi:hypothetical protein
MFIAVYFIKNYIFKIKLKGIKDFQMAAILYIDISGKLNYSFEKEIISELKNRIPSIESLDIDQDSEPLTIDYAKRFLFESDGAILYVESTAELANKILPFTEIIIKNPEKYLVFLQGENQWLEKICKGINQNYLKKGLAKDEELKHSISFLKF